MSDEIQDVIQIGLGPVGLTMAAVVGQAGHAITVVERHHSLYGLPRAGHIDHEIVRILQSLDAEGPVLEDCYPTLEYVWVNAHGETLLEFDWGAEGVSGYHSDYMQYQPVLEKSLARRLAGDEHVTLLQGWEGVAFADHGDHVEVTVARTRMEPGNPRPVVTDERRTLRGRYLIGADGANSAVRRWLGIERDDLGFNERWLDVDARKKRELHFDFDCGQICDPRRPITVLPLGKRHRRWEWALLPGETVEEFERPETAWRLLGELGLGEDDIEIVRQLVYTFEARTAQRFRAGNAFLIGDAAHTMPPFMGQGMCSGMRDAKNLGWKLDLVLRGMADDALLDTYEEELRPYVLDWTVISLEAGKIPCTTDPEAARDRDARFRAGWRPPLPDFPKLRDGLIDRGDDGRPLGAAGELGPQARVRRDGEDGLFDRLFDAAGRWQVLSVEGDPASALSDEQRARFEELGAVLADVSAIDLEGRYAEWFAQRDARVLIARPDFYVYGTAATLADLPALVDRLLSELPLTVPAWWA
jgi:2-polyprenyl-6-methoxyphenol hydroxylase-like FAD-dependent oxidoreductase